MPRVTEDTEKKKKLQELKIPTCLNCGTRNEKHFYKSHNPFNKYTGYIPYCKDCIRNDMWSYYLRRFKNNEQVALHALLRSLNLPYVHSLYLASVKNITNPNSKINVNTAPTINADSDDQKDAKADNSPEDKIKTSALVSAYIKNYNSFYGKNSYGDVYADSEGITEIQGLSAYEDILKVQRKVKEDNFDNIDTEKYEVLEYDADELVFKWGSFPDEKLIRLEREYLDWADKLGDYIYDKSTDLIVKQVCQQTVEIEDKRLLGEKVKDELSALQALLNSSGLIEKTRGKSAETTKIGMTIREIENNRPLKKVSKDLEDVDKYGELLTTFLGGISRTLGKENEFTKNFDKLYKKYSINLDKFSDASDDGGA